MYLILGVYILLKRVLRRILMDKLSVPAIYLILSALILFPLHTHAQDTAPSAPTAQTPDVIQTPPDFPEYIVTPRENLNNYDLSTMTESKGIDYRDGVGTLGTTEKRRSNLEVNAELKRKRQDREKAKQSPKEEKEYESQDKASAGNLAPSRDSGEKVFSPGVKRGLFTWTDENGVLHATNNLGQVPIDYQIQALEKSKGSLNIRRGTDKK